MSLKHSLSIYAVVLQTFQHWHAYCVPESMHLRTNYGLTK